MTLLVHPDYNNVFTDSEQIPSKYREIYDRVNYRGRANRFRFWDKYKSDWDKSDDVAWLLRRDAYRALIIYEGIAFNCPKYIHTLIRTIGWVQKQRDIMSFFKFSHLIIHLERPGSGTYFAYHMSTWCHSDGIIYFNIR